MTEVGTFEKIIQTTARKIREGHRLTQAEIAMLAGYADGAAEMMPNMRQTIKTQDEMLEKLRQTVSSLRGVRLSEMAKDMEDHE